MEGLDLTLQSVLLLSNRLSLTADRDEFFGEVKGESQGSVGLIRQNQGQTRPLSVCPFPGHSAGLISCEWRGRARSAQSPPSLSRTVTP